MSVTKIATRYAKSLLSLAAEQGKLAVVAADMASFGQAAKNQDLNLLLKSPIIKPEQKNTVLAALFQGKMDALSMSYLTLLVNKGREPYLAEIAAEFSTQYKVMLKITSVRVTTATPMTDDLLAEIKSRLLASGVTTENLDIETHVDPELIGGFVLEFDNKRYDSSVAHKLDQLKSQFTKNLYIKEF